jgi:hypothetical protein
MDLRSGEENIHFSTEQSCTVAFCSYLSQEDAREGKFI